MFESKQSPQNRAHFSNEQDFFFFFRFLYFMPTNCRAKRNQYLNTPTQTKKTFHDFVDNGRTNDNNHIFTRNVH